MRGSRSNGTNRVAHGDEACRTAACQRADRGSQIGAWASDQSAPLASREALLERVSEFEREFDGREVPRPPYWTGFALSPETVEFWTQREFRLHDRFRYTLANGEWTRQRLYP